MLQEILPLLDADTPPALLEMFPLLFISSEREMQIKFNGNGIRYYRNVVQAAPSLLLRAEMAQPERSKVTEGNAKTSLSHRPSSQCPCTSKGD